MEEDEDEKPEVRGKRLQLRKTEGSGHKYFYLGRFPQRDF